MYQDPAVQQPVADPRIEADGWRLEAYITGNDTVFDLGERVFYGFIARAIDSPEEHVVVVRGTQGFIEWAIDAEFVLRPYPKAGKVENGFYGVYQTLQLQMPGAADSSLISGLAGIIGTGHAIITGHSLGAAMATYLAVDLALAHIYTAGRFFASPHAGDANFAAYAAVAIRDYASYAYARDIVPLLPLGLGFEPLPARITLPANASVRGGLFCNHHAACYTYMLDPTALHPVLIDAQYMGCIVASPGTFRAPPPSPTTP